MKDNSSQSWYWHFGQAAKSIPFNAWLRFAGILLAIPTSYFGLVWLEYKIAKQEVNCYTDLYTNIGASTPLSPETQIERITKEIEGYNICNRAVDPKISTVEFLKKEHKRGDHEQ